MKALNNILFHLTVAIILTTTCHSSNEDFSIARIVTDGRLGNVIFKYASVVGICLKRNVKNIKLCARLCSTVRNIENNDIFVETFPNVNRSVDNFCEYVSNSDSKSFTEKDINFDPRAFNQPNGLFYLGYYQSYKYFHPHGSSYIKSLFQFSSSITRDAENAIVNIKKSPIYVKSYPLVCLSSRRGDKVRGRLSDYTYYDKYSLNEGYYNDALNHNMDLFGRVNLVIFSGGGTSSSDRIEDLQWTSSFLKPYLQNGRWNNKIFTIEDFQNYTNIDNWYENPTLTLKVLTLCDSLVISSSTFSWWAAYLSSHQYVVAPRYIYASNNNLNFKPEDYYLPKWKTLTDRYRSEDFIEMAGKDLSNSNIKVSGNNETTIITAYFSMSSKYDGVRYLEWIDVFMKMNFKLVIFVDKVSFKLLNASWPKTNRRIYMFKPINSFHTKKWNWTKDELIDPEISVGHNQLLYKVWNEKVFLMRDVVLSNPFSTDYFAWLDIGCFRNKLLIHNFEGFPDPSKINKNKVNFVQINPFLDVEIQNVYPVDSRFIYNNRIGGGHIIGKKNVILLFAVILDEIIEEMKTHNVFAGKDQSNFAFSLLRHPYLFQSFIAPDNNYDKWFIAQYLWSKVGKPFVTPLVLTKNEKLPKYHNPCYCKVCLLLLSTVYESRTRDAIREGWLSKLFNYSISINKKSKLCQLPIDYKFVIGRSAKLENKDSKEKQKFDRTETLLRHEMNYIDDIWYLPFNDDYWNLTMKVSLMFKMAPEKFPDCKYFFKVDSDVYIHAKEFHSMVTTTLTTALKKNQRVYGGYYYDQKEGGRRSAVSRDPNNRHAMTVEEFKNDYYDPYAGGPLYFMSTEVARALPYKIVQKKNKETVPSNYVYRPQPVGIYKLEDVFMGHLIYKLKPSVLTINVDNIWPLQEYANYNKKDLEKQSLVSYHGVKSLKVMREGFS